MVRLFAVVIALLPLAVWAQPTVPQLPGGYRPEFKEDAPWEEQKAALPFYPKSENLVKISIDMPTSFEFFVDALSIGVGRDGVVRYTLVARSSGGSLNVSFEGIRCAVRERKLYAFGRTDNTWSEARNAQWAPIAAVPTSRQHASLADDFFCSFGAPVKTAEDALKALRAGSYSRAGLR